MVRIPAKVTNERREQVWLLMLKGYSPQSIIKTLGTTQAVVYNDIKFLTNKSKQYVYDMAKGTHVLMFQRAIDGIGLALASSWDKFNDPQVPEKQKMSYLRLAKDCHSEILSIVQNGPTVMGFINMADKARRLGVTPQYPPLPELTEEQQIEDYANLGKNDYIPYTQRNPVDDDNPDGLPDTSDPNDFSEDPKLITSGCMRRYGSYSYSHRRHKEGEYCYMRDKEEKEKEAAAAHGFELTK